jgi:hypothetical protein
MKLINDIGAPEPVIRMIEGFQKRYLEGRDGERRTDWSVTTLIQPPYKVQLERRHDDTLEARVSDLLYALSGSSMHLALELAGKTLGSEYVLEKRLYTEVMGDVVSGAVDLVQFTPAGSVIYDYKECSVWEVLKGIKPEKVAQLNLLAELWRRNGYPNIGGLKLWLRFRDWSPTEKLRISNYPPRAMTVDVPIWSQEDATAYLRARVLLHQAARSLPDDRISICTPEERWQDPPEWAVMKEGRKSAVRVLPSKTEAETMLAEKGAGHYIQERPSEPRRCIAYCTSAPVCRYAKSLKVEAREED